MIFFSFCHEMGANKLAKGGKRSETKLKFNTRPQKSKKLEKYPK